ncbi:MAG TPA: PrpF domain-containing protein [Negativicutes bacterium]|nr:PrpF domain-containing protein [Negativicutes bacterium]
MSQFSIPCSVYRGGTSRGLFFQKKDLPEDATARNKIFLEGIDCYNPSQVNGLGGTTSSTSKVCVISPSSHEGADADWTFYQLGVAEAVVDDKGTCGNLMAAVGAFVVDEGLAVVDPAAEMAEVFVYNTNIKKMLQMEIPVINGKAKVGGDYLMPGVVKPGAMFRVSIMNPGGELTGKQLLLGSKSEVKTDKATYGVTFSDLINPFVFLAGTDVGLSGDESHKEVAANQAILDELNLIRDKMAVIAGMAKTEQDARQNKPNVPKIAVISPAQDYVTTGGELIRKEDVDILVKVVSMGKLHRTSPASCLYNLAATTLLEGTIPNQVAGFQTDLKDRMVRIGHPEGIVEVRVTLTEDGQKVAKVGMERTARRIMKGEIYTPVM